MNQINWKSKLTSRKFWIAIISFVTLLLTSFGLPDNVVSQVSAIVMAGATVIAYIIGEGLIDSQNVASSSSAQDDQAIDQTTK
jgi:uncharacterized membrane protein